MSYLPAFIQQWASRRVIEPIYYLSRDEIKDMMMKGELIHLLEYAYNEMCDVSDFKERNQAGGEEIRSLIHLDQIALDENGQLYFKVGRKEFSHDYETIDTSVER